MKKTKEMLALSAVLCLLVWVTALYSHCQIPCGIYDDPARLKSLAEHITTIEKAMTEINTLSANPGPNANQLVRWINNKDDHADQFSEIVTYYFMAQRITPADKTDAQAWSRYIHQLTLLHQMLVTSMKCKQTIDPQNTRILRQLLDDFEKTYTNQQPSAAPDMPHSH